MKVFLMAATAAIFVTGAASAQTVLGTGSWSGSNSGTVIGGTSAAGTLGNGFAGASNTSTMNLSSIGMATGMTVIGNSGSQSSTLSTGGANNTSTGFSLGFGTSQATGNYNGSNGSVSGAFGGFGISF